MRFQRSIGLLATLALLSACASIIEGSTDTVNINNVSPAPMTCNAINERGSWVGNAPGQVTVKKSRTDLKLTCNDSRTGGTANGTLVSEVEPWAFGNIVFGGIIGLGVDWGTGAAYNYPDNITVAPAAAAMQSPAVQYFAPAVAVPAPVSEPVTVPVGSPSAPGSVQYFAPAPQPAQPATIAPLPFGGPTPAPAY